MDTAAGLELLLLLKEDVVTLEEAHRRNIALPSKDKVFPPDLRTASRQD
jgi:hypothetical protein